MGLCDTLLRWTRRNGTMPAMTTETTPEHARELWSIRELAAWMGVSHQTIHQRIERGTLRPHYFVRTGGRTMYLFDPARTKRWRDIHA